MATHVPFRSWCPFCVTGKAPQDQHRRTQQGPGGVAKLSIDFAFMGAGQEEEQGGHNPIIVLEDDTSKVITAHIVPKEGVDEHTVARIAQDIKNLGYKKIILKSDQEPAILALKEEIRRTLDIDVIMEESPVGESQSNGRVERAVRTVKGQIRTLKESLDSRFQERIPSHHPVLAWMPRHAAATITRYQVGPDGKLHTPDGKGKSSNGRSQNSVNVCGTCDSAQSAPWGC